LFVSFSFCTLVCSRYVFLWCLVTLVPSQSNCN
jgi:hypothetical protein